MKGARYKGEGADKHKYYCGSFIGLARLPGSDGFCGPRHGPQCEECREYQARLPFAPVKAKGGRFYCGRYVGAGLASREGICGPEEGPQCEDCANHECLVMMHLPRLGEGTGSNKYYCGRFVGIKECPGRNGVCGPKNGPQCSECKAYQAHLPFEPKRGTGPHHNSYYCGRYIGDSLIGSDGICGPQAGPSCDDCLQYQKSQEAAQHNPKQGLGRCSHKYYCGQYIGKEALPGSNGYCGPASGPQCEKCRDYQAHLPYQPKENALRMFYCGRFVGFGLSMDGICGPESGPQCEDCKKQQIERVRPKLGKGEWGHLYYCGTFIGKLRLPGSDGFCGPDKGPQCESCKLYQTLHPFKS